MLPKLRDHHQLPKCKGGERSELREGTEDRPEEQKRADGNQRRDES